MAVWRCMVECLSFYAILLILYSQGSIAWSLEIALFLNPESWSLSHDSCFKCQQTKKKYNTRATHFTEIVYLKQKQECMLSLVFKKLDLFSVMPASRSVNPLTTSHTVEHSSSICLHSWSHDNPILYLINHCFNI